MPVMITSRMVIPVYDKPHRITVDLSTPVYDAWY